MYTRIGIQFGFNLLNSIERIPAIPKHGRPHCNARYRVLTIQSINIRKLIFTHLNSMNPFSTVARLGPSGPFSKRKPFKKAWMQYVDTFDTFTVLKVQSNKLQNIAVKTLFQYPTQYPCDRALLVSPQQGHEQELIVPNLRVEKYGKESQQ